MMPRLRTPGTIEWELELTLDCDGPAARDDGIWGWALHSWLNGNVQHCIFLRGLIEDALE